MLTNSSVGMIRLLFRDSLLDKVSISVSSIDRCPSVPTGYVEVKTFTLSSRARNCLTTASIALSRGSNV